jgi:hypothetical protein
MYSTSQKFKDAVYAPSRSTKGKVTVDISDTTIATDTITTTVTSESTLSNKAQLTDKVRENSYKIATWENDRFKLDGSFTFADDIIANNLNLGWCSNPLCDSTGVFSPNQTLSFSFGAIHNSAGITVTFDTVNNEYASDFDVIAYNSIGTAIWTTNVTNNTKSMLQVFGQFSNYKKIDVVIKKWCKGNRRARIAEIDFGIVNVYTDDNLISLNLIEEVDIISVNIPSPELKFTVDNSDRLFNILNPTGFYKYLQQRQQVIAEIGLDIGGSIEWIPVGNYLLWDWTSDEGSLTATFTARTNLDLMNNFTYENLTAKTSYSLYQMAVDLFALCGITNYTIDTTLQSITTNALVQKASCRDILQMIAIAGSANIFVSRSNKIIIKCLPTNIGSNSDTISMNEMYEEAKIELQKIIKTANVTYFTNLTTSAISTVNNTGILIGDVLSVENNTLINTSTQATNVANWIINQSNLRSKYMLNWRGNPSHELLDVLSIANSYGSNMSAYVTKTEIDYQGYLSAKTESRGVVN